MNKILILYASIGHGHRVIAENIGYSLEQAGYEVVYHDIHKIQTGKLVDVSTSIYKKVNEHTPGLWHWIYTSKWLTELTLPHRIRVAARNFAETKKLVDEVNPDLIICTQNTASGVISYLKQQGLYKKLFAIAFSDFHLHRFWIYNNADFFLVNIEEQKRQMIQLGVPSEKIFICGITLKPLPQIDKQALRQKFSLDEGEKMVLLANGSLGLGAWDATWLVKITKDILQKAQEQGIAAKIFVVCGNNKNLRDLLDKKLASEKIKIFGFFTPMNDLYAIADVFVSKPGGLSTAESLAFGLPMIVTHVLPGGEELNFEYLKNKGLILPALGGQNIADIVVDEIKHEQFRKNLLQNPNLSAVVDVDNPGQRVVEAVRSFQLDANRSIA